MIRVLQVGLTSNRGGTEAFVMTMYRNINREEIQFDFLVEHDKKLPFEEEIKQLGGNVYYSYYFMRDKNKEGYISIEDFFDRHPEISGVHLNSNGLNTTFRILLEAKRRKLPIRILHSHNNGYMHPYSWKEKVYEFYAKTMIKRVVTQKLACSDEAAKWMFGNMTDYKVIPNAIDVGKFAYDEQKRKQIREELNIQKDQVLLGFVGSFNYQKDPEFLIEIIHACHKKNENYKLLMLGQGALFEKVKQKIKEYGLEDSVFCLGNRQNVWDYMQAMDLFVLPSNFEGFGIVLVEAQAAGVPCITSKDVVPESANVANQVTYHSKDKGAKYWAEQIMIHEKKRFDGQAVLKDSEYDVKHLAKLMEQVYLGQ